ncbi:MAG TPA: DNA polymerase III subunit delta [Actinomycetota bacterium]|jgi:DNA polymerase-3 subunit delta|nr:DNA polymerase III subunit delta [Actinomycetota bacterium]
MTARSDSPVVLFWGEDPFLLRTEALELLGEVRPREIDASDWAPGATADLATPSLFGEPRALVLTDSGNLPDEGREEVAVYARSPAPDATLVLLVEVGPRAKGPPAALSKALPKGVEVRRVAVERRELPAWVRARARRRGLTASPAGASALVEILGEDPAVLDQAVEQIAAAFSKDGVTPETVAAQFRGLGERRVWELSDLAFGRNLPGALRTLAALLEAREEPLMILGGLAARLRDLLRVRALPERMAPAEAARVAGLRFDWQVRRYREQARRFSEEEMAGVHEQVSEADRLLKQGAPGDVVLAKLLVRIAGPGEIARTGARG